MSTTTPSFYREAQLIGSRAAPEQPRVAGLLPISSATLWRWVKRGAFPAPVKLSDRMTAWRADDVQAWIAKRDSAARTPA